MNYITYSIYIYMCTCRCVCVCACVFAYCHYINVYARVHGTEGGFTVSYCVKPCEEISSISSKHVTSLALELEKLFLEEHQALPR